MKSMRQTWGGGKLSEVKNITEITGNDQVNSRL